MSRNWVIIAKLLCRVHTTANIQKENENKSGKCEILKPTQIETRFCFAVSSLHCNLIKYDT